MFCIFGTAIFIMSLSIMVFRALKKTKIGSVEPPCKKTIYQSKEEAEDMIRYINETRVTRYLKAYKCNICGFWHLTSKS
ncbi:MAG TPA: hypothetical protein PLX08_11620 [Bacteroidales bacterium]|nr:hypothetical protein [Bacteroidales bacterium]